jgi:adenylate kinase
MKLIFISGLAGIDKETLVDLALQRSGRKNDFAVIDFDKIGSLADEIGDIPDMEAVRRVASRFYEKLEKTLITSLKGQRGDIIVNGYLTFATKHGYVRAIPDEFFRSFKPDTLVILEKADDLIAKDDAAIEHQKINRYYASIYASAAGSALKIIKFRDRKMIDSVKELSELLKQ